MAKVGRPKKIINYDLVESLGSIHCTVEEIANILDLNKRTLERDTEFCRIYKKSIDNGRMCLRRKQWEAANEGNTTMLIWLGKQYLGQKEKAEMEATVYTPQSLADFYSDSDAKKKAKTAYSRTKPTIN